jgi:hypothetical protein
MARLLVETRYPAPHVLEVLPLRDVGDYCGVNTPPGEVWLRLQPGDEHRLYGQISSFRAEKARNGLISLRRYSGSGRPQEERYVIAPNVRYLWALSPGSARRGLVHRYREPQDRLERILHNRRQSKRVHPLTTDRRFVTYDFYQRVSDPRWAKLLTDGKLKLADEQTCYDAERERLEWHVRGGTYAISLSGCYSSRYFVLENITVFAVPNANRERIADRLEAALAEIDQHPPQQGSPDEVIPGYIALTALRSRHVL